ncbi:MAG: DNA pilot protein [Microviridae sp.]|nr:MAG: DNA pilot protein [Microviridae sp.]
MGWGFSNPFDNLKDHFSDGANSFGKYWIASRMTNGSNLFGGSGGGGGGGGMDWGALGSSALDFYSSERANQQSAQSVKDQMQFQMMMSNTAYQRAMADMAAAGLNPMLAYQQGGASTPGGASYKANVPTPGTAYQQAATSTAQRTLLAQQAEKVNLEKGNVAADTALKVAQSISEAERPGLIRGQLGTELERQTLLRADTAKSVAARQQALTTVDLLYKQIATETQRAAAEAARVQQEQAKGSIADHIKSGSESVKKVFNKVREPLTRATTDLLDWSFLSGPQSAREAAQDYFKREYPNKNPGYIRPEQFQRIH